MFKAAITKYIKESYLIPKYNRRRIRMNILVTKKFKIILNKNNNKLPIKKPNHTLYKINKITYKLTNFITNKLSNKIINKLINKLTNNLFKN